MVLRVRSRVVDVGDPWDSLVGVQTVIYRGWQISDDYVARKNGSTFYGDSLTDVKRMIDRRMNAPVIVHLVNRQTLHARAGYGEGDTLANAQQNALECLRHNYGPNYLTDKNVKIEAGGWEIHFDGGVNC